MDAGERIFEKIDAVELPNINHYFLSEALYSMNECGIWPDGNFVNSKVALRCWQLAEWLKTLEEFPDNMKM